MRRELFDFELILKNYLGLGQLENLNFIKNVNVSYKWKYVCWILSIQACSFNLFTTILFRFVSSMMLGVFLFLATSCLRVQTGSNFLLYDHLYLVKFFHTEFNFLIPYVSSLDILKLIPTIHIYYCYILFFSRAGLPDDYF